MVQPGELGTFVLLTIGMNFCFLWGGGGRLRWEDVKPDAGRHLWVPLGPVLMSDGSGISDGAGRRQHACRIVAIEAVPPLRAGDRRVNTRTMRGFRAQVRPCFGGV